MAFDEYDEDEPDETSDTVIHCSVCGASFDYCGNGEGFVVESPQQSRPEFLPDQFKFCFYCAGHIARSFDQLCAERDECEHGVQCGDWCEPCNKAYREARIEAGEDA